MNKIKVAFLDRDGTIVREYDDDGWINRTDPEILDGTISSLKQLRELGYEIIIITNQSLIGKGLIKIEEYHKFNENLLDELYRNGIDILDIFYCPHTKEENCSCKKPKPGMILKALDKYNIDISKSFVAGDSSSDEGLAEYFEMKFFGICYAPKSAENIKVSNLLDIIEYLDTNKKIQY